MDEKRFEVLFYGDVINCVRDETGKEYNLHELISILMEQQATIQSLKEENEQLRFLIDINSVSERKKLERQVDEQQATINELKERTVYNFAKKMQLQKEIKELKEEEKLYAKEIVRLNKNIEELNKTIEEALKFKSLGGDY